MATYFAKRVSTALWVPTSLSGSVSWIGLSAMFEQVLRSSTTLGRNTEKKHTYIDQDEMHENKGQKSGGRRKLCALMFTVVLLSSILLVAKNVLLFFLAIFVFFHCAFLDSPAAMPTMMLLNNIQIMLFFPRTKVQRRAEADAVHSATCMFPSCMFYFSYFYIFTKKQQRQYPTATKKRFWSKFRTANNVLRQ